MKSEPRIIPLDKEWVDALKTNIQLGMMLIDTAEMYGGGHAEEIVSVAIRGFKREDLFMVSKVWPIDAAYKNVLRSATVSSRKSET
jgi:diketogulonate reductase-like aldo/keto reductase